MVSKNPPPAGSDFGLRPSQGQSRFLDTIHFPAYPSNIFRARFLLFYISIIFHKGPGKGRKILHRLGLTSAYGLRRAISRVWANRGAERRMGATHHLVLNVRFRESKSTVKVKSFFRTYQSLFIIYPLYKFRELSSFYLQNYFPQRTGEGRYIFIYLSPKLY